MERNSSGTGCGGLSKESRWRILGYNLVGYLQTNMFRYLIYMWMKQEYYVENRWHHCPFVQSFRESCHITSRPWDFAICVTAILIYPLLLSVLKLHMLFLTELLMYYLRNWNILLRTEVGIVNISVAMTISSCLLIGMLWSASSLWRPQRTFQRTLFSPGCTVEE